MSTARLATLSEVDSTNALARRILRAERSAPAATAIAAWTQTNGRGRRGRTWASGAGEGVWASLIWPLSDSGELVRLPIVMAVTLCEALRAMGARECRLRWPNDLVVAERKLGGLLIETVSSGSRPGVAILGFGVNHSPPGPAVPRPTVGLAELARDAPAVGEMARRMLTELLTALAAEPSEARTGWVDSYRRLSAHEEGERIVCRLPGGDVRGSFAGFDDRGFLEMIVDGELRTVSSGELIES